MNGKVLQEGDTIIIKRTNGALQTAVISAIEYDLQCVKVEWFENGDTKGKEIHFNNVQSLNHNVSLLRPQLPEKDSESSGDEERRFKSPDSRRHTSARESRIQSAKTRVTQSQLSNNLNDPNDEPLKIEGKAIHSARTTRSVIETASKFKDGTVKRVNKLERDRYLDDIVILWIGNTEQPDRQTRRKKQAEAKAVKDEFLRKTQNNPHWELMNMIQKYRRQIEFRPLSHQDVIEEHLITVAVRKRPLNDLEIGKKEIDIITVPSKNQIVVHEPKHKVDLTKYLDNHMFKFDYALNEHSSNEIVYKYTAQPLVKTIFDGGFATCFAYGQTGSGKTYTMSGSFEGKHERGIYALTAADIFKKASQGKYRHRNFIVSCSFFEIYVKKVYDLLNNKKLLKVLEDGQQQVQIVGLTEKIVSSVNEVLELIYQGNEERASGQTSANSQSSRSHAIFQFYLRNQDSPRLTFGKFSLIDLAGNERGADTFSSSKITRLEGAEINQSLLSLKECIRALGRKGAHLPFRGSKLTQILRDSFVGQNSKTCMIAMISPGVGSCENTLNTLRYADRVKELGGGDITTNKENNGKDDLTCFYGTQSLITHTEMVPAQAKSKRDEMMVNQNKDLVKILQKYAKVAENLYDVSDEDPKKYQVNLNNVVSDAISSLLKIKNSINYSMSFIHISTYILNKIQFSSTQ